MIPADQERIVGVLGFFEDFFRDAGVPEGAYFMTALIEFEGGESPMEMFLGPVLLATHNGLRLGVPNATRRAVIWGRVSLPSGASVPGAFVGYDLSWQDCNRAPLWQGSTTSEANGAYRIEVSLEDEVPEVCVTLRVNPPPGFLTLPVQRITAQLDFDRTPTSGVVADSIRVDIVLGT